jgi:hypothetical protein
MRTHRSTIAGWEWRDDPRSLGRPRKDTAQPIEVGQGNRKHLERDTRRCRNFGGHVSLTEQFAPDTLART